MNVACFFNRIFSSNGPLHEFSGTNAIPSYNNSGLAACDGKLTAYSGGFIKNITVFNKRNLIAVENVTTPLRKKQGIISLVMHLKTNELSNEVKVHIQKDSLSDELEKMLTL